VFHQFCFICQLTGSINIANMTVPIY
jgi:hypothetical protein